MGTEKRAHPRFPLILAVDYPGAASTVRDYTENLSAGGLFIRTEREFEVGDRLALLLSFPELLEPAELEVEVVRLRRGGRLAAARASRCGSRPTGWTTGAAWSGSPPRRPRRPRPAARSYRVLLVEDNSLVAAMYASALRRLAATEGLGGLAVDVAVDGNEAFARLLAQPPIDLIITDVYMPVMSGFALVEKVRAEPRLRHLPIIVISSAGRRGAGAGEPAGRQLLPAEAGQVPGHRRHRPDPAPGRPPAGGAHVHPSSPHSPRSPDTAAGFPPRTG